jgi:hypothetical protein
VIETCSAARQAAVCLGKSDVSNQTLTVVDSSHYRQIPLLQHESGCYGADLTHRNSHGAPIELFLREMIRFVESCLEPEPSGFSCSASEES